MNTTELKKKRWVVRYVTTVAHEALVEAPTQEEALDALANGRALSDDCVAEEMDFDDIEISEEEA